MARVGGGWRGGWRRVGGGGSRWGCGGTRMKVRIRVRGGVKTVTARKSARWGWNDEGEKEEEGGGGE